MFSLAKVKRKRINSGLQKLLSDSKLFEDFDISKFGIFDYNPETLQEEDHFYRLEKFSTFEFYPDWLKNPVDSKDYFDIEKKDYQEISYIVEIDDDNIFAFQSLNKSTYLKCRKFFELGEEITIEDKKTILVIKDIPDAYYDRSTDSLFFRNLIYLEKMFPGASSLYKEATNDQVKDFLTSGIFTLKNNFTSENVSVLNRKKIALCLSTFSKLTHAQKTLISKSVQSHKPSLYDSVSNSYVVDSDESLKLVLYALQERFFTTIATNKKTIANSVIAV
ncbi:hypothetical protein ACLS0R_10385 [Comamonas jiangduensis]|uniref:hypothetical protein n=1 Tax=Comamonas jiangduensis TaxID=1194168 RepID=UPI003BF8C02D